MASHRELELKSLGKTCCARSIMLLPTIPKLVPACWVRVHESKNKPESGLGL